MDVRENEQHLICIDWQMCSENSLWKK